MPPYSNISHCKSIHERAFYPQPDIGFGISLASEISANETAHSRAAASGSVEGREGGRGEERKLASSQTDRQTDTRETTRDLWNMKTIEPTVHQIGEWSDGQTDSDIAARNDRSQSLQCPNGWFRFVHGRGKLMLPCCVTGQVLQIRPLSFSQPAMKNYCSTLHNSSPPHSLSSDNYCSVRPD